MEHRPNSRAAVLAMVSAIAARRVSEGHAYRPPASKKPRPRDARLARKIRRKSDA